MLDTTTTTTTTTTIAPQWLNNATDVAIMAHNNHTNGAHNNHTNVSPTFYDDADVGVGEPPGPLITLFVPLLMFSTGLLGNVVALVLLWRSRRDNARSVFYRLVTGLALTDLLGTLATSPITLLVYSQDRQWVGGQPVCDYFSFMMIFAGLATVLMVGCMAVERFLAILHPYTYERHVSPWRANCVLVGIWAASAVVSCLPLVKVGSNVNHWPGTWCFFDFYSQRAVDQMFAVFFATIGLLVIVSTAVCNVAVMVVLLRMRRVSQNIGKSKEGRTLNMTSEMQMIFFLAGIIFVFAACYAPLMVRIILNVATPTHIDQRADLLAIRLASVNQILDPWVYLLFRRRLARLLYTVCKSVSPLHTLSSLKALRAPPESGEGGSDKGKESPAKGRKGEGCGEEGGKAGGDGDCVEGGSDKGKESLAKGRKGDGFEEGGKVGEDCNGGCGGAGGAEEGGGGGVVIRGSRPSVPEQDVERKSVVQAGLFADDTSKTSDLTSRDGFTSESVSDVDEKERDLLRMKYTEPVCTDDYDGHTRVYSEQKVLGQGVSDRFSDQDKSCECVTEKTYAADSEDAHGSSVPRRHSSSSSQTVGESTNRRKWSLRSRNRNSANASVSEQESKRTSRTSILNGICNEGLAVHDTGIFNHPYSDGGKVKDTRLTSSASWPVICLHGKQAVVKVMSDREDCHPLLLSGGKRRSQGLVVCCQCQQDSDGGVISCV